MSERSVGMGGENLRRRLSNESLLLSPCKACNPKARVPEPGVRAVPSAFPVRTLLAVTIQAGHSSLPWNMVT
jgi:hypothetical protein